MPQSLLPYLPPLNFGGRFSSFCRRSPHSSKWNHNPFPHCCCRHIFLVAIVRIACYKGDLLLLPLLLR
jgi:hypothetical protein